jgi:hypothetical protein
MYAAAHIVSSSLACGLLLLFVLAIVLLALRGLPLESVASIGALSSKAVLALPGIIMAGLLMEKIHLTPLRPFLYPLGAVSSYTLLDLYLYLDRVD